MILSIRHLSIILLLSGLLTALLVYAETNLSREDEARNAVSDKLLGHHFITIIESDDLEDVKHSLEVIEQHWSIKSVPMALEAYIFRSAPVVREKLHSLIEQSTGISSPDDLNPFHQWVWNQEFSFPSDYANFKAELYERIDPRFDRYFRERANTARIRLDEIRWGGVLQDGIPPLRQPKMLAIDAADYLEDDNIVFGIEINGDARAYPKRILAWHEMFTDVIGGVSIAGVYCTLCGTVIPYRTEVNGVKYQLGTSGFLYRSNKLMYDKATQSLWSTQRGEPVLGPLVDKGITLTFESVVTTTWGEWKKRHPDTTVLSLNTGHQRDYGEGVAYTEYFADDRLMFNTPFNDERLKNKQEVLALRFAAAPSKQLAIDTDFLNKNILYKNSIGRQAFVVLTDKSGANRVYDPKGVRLNSYDGELTVIDEGGGAWTLHEEHLINDKGEKLNRLPYHRAFWFGWLAAFPETQLIK